VIEERESTFVINGRAAIGVDEFGNVIVEAEYAPKPEFGRKERFSAH